MEFRAQTLQQTVGNPMGSNFAPLLAGLFLYEYDAEVIQGLYLKAGKRHLVQKLNFIYKYIVDVISLNNSNILQFIDLIYSCKLEIKNSTESYT